MSEKQRCIVHWTLHRAGPTYGDFRRVLRTYLQMRVIMHTNVILIAFDVVTTTTTTTVTSIIVVNLIIPTIFFRILCIFHWFLLAVSSFRV